MADAPAAIPAEDLHVIRYQGSPSQAKVRPALLMIPAERPPGFLWISLWISLCAESGSRRWPEESFFLLTQHIVPF
jgi:hypothetical protein